VFYAYINSVDQLRENPFFEWSAFYTAARRPAGETPPHMLVVIQLLLFHQGYIPLQAHARRRDALRTLGVVVLTAESAKLIVNRGR